MRYFLKLAYRGAPFHGWQRQPNASSVQQTIEEALATILRAEVPIVGAGRTDTGVNARCMYAHFDMPAAAVPKEPAALLRGLNRICGPDIALQSLIPVPDDAHARFDATERTYKYFVTESKSPFLYPLAWHSPVSLDIEMMNRAAEMLLTTDDFTSFAKLHSDAKTNICDVRHALWTRCDSAITGEPMLVFTITADRFLRNMVRAVTGTLVEVGRGKMTLDGFARVIEAKDRCAAATSMPACALTLWEVKYAGLKL